MLLQRAMLMKTPTGERTGQKDMAQGALARDKEVTHGKEQCLMCYASENLECAHIVDLELKPWKPGDKGVYQRNVYHNGITLCKYCHTYFDAGYWTLTTEAKIKVSNVLRKVVTIPSCLEGMKEYKRTRFANIVRREGEALVPLDKNRDQWPPQAALEYRASEYFDRKQEARQKRRKENATCMCPVCLKQFTNKKGVPAKNHTCKLTMCTPPENLLAAATSNGGIAKDVAEDDHDDDIDVDEDDDEIESDEDDEDDEDE